VMDKEDYKMYCERREFAQENGCIYKEPLHPLAYLPFPFCVYHNRFHKFDEWVPLTRKGDLTKSARKR
jgi:hypothetical protein